jgi:hypothetical protein
MGNTFPYVPSNFGIVFSITRNSPGTITCHPIHNWITASAQYLYVPQIFTHLINAVLFCCIPVLCHYINAKSLYCHINEEIQGLYYSSGNQLDLRNINRTQIKMRVKERYKLRRFLQRRLSLHWWYMKRDHYTSNYFMQVSASTAGSGTYGCQGFAYNSNSLSVLRSTL